MSKENTVRTVGKRKLPEISFHASAELLIEAAKFNDEIHKLPYGNETGVKKGVYRFGHENANKHQDDCITELMVSIHNRKMHSGK